MGKVNPVEIMQAAEELKDEIIVNRRVIHGFAELGFDLDQTVEFVMQKLTEMGCRPQRLGKAGVTCTLGKGTPTILLRADMDALPMPDESGELFAATNGNCHACGHDAHAAMLLGAARILKSYEEKLEGTVKLMFQPAEEILGGASDMIENGILENPAVDAAFALHVEAGEDYKKAGNIQCCHGTVSNSADLYNIHVIGQDAHGATAYLGVDAVTIAAHIVLALQNIVDKETPSWKNNVILVGTIKGGTAGNTVADLADMEVTVRTGTSEQRAFLRRRIEEIADGIARTFRGRAQVEHVYGTPPQVNDDLLSHRFQSYAEELLPDGVIQEASDLGLGAEDFAFITDRVPGVFFYLFVGSPAEGYSSGIHTTTFRINESVLPTGTAIHAYTAMRYLQDRKKGTLSL